MQNICVQHEITIIKELRNKFGDRAFSVAGLTVWNSLSDQLRLLLVLSAS